MIRLFGSATVCIPISIPGTCIYQAWRDVRSPEKSGDAVWMYGCEAVSRAEHLEFSP
jgi:hypothetical protein